MERKLSRKNKVRLSLQGRQLPYLWKLGFWKNMYLPPWACQFPIFKDFSGKTGKFYSHWRLSVSFWYYIIKCANIWNNCITQWIKIFQMTNVTKLCMNIYLKCKTFLQLNKVQDKQMFTVIEWKFHWYGFRFYTELTFKKLPLLWFRCGIKEYPQLI